jgi:hypothetical protein
MGRSLVAHVVCLWRDHAWIDGEYTRDLGGYRVLSRECTRCGLVRAFI